MYETLHINKRLRQRGITKRMIELTLEFGEVMSRVFKIVSSICLLVIALQAEEKFGENRAKIITSDQQIVALNNSDEKRMYPFKDTLMPLVGYRNDRAQGVMGIECSMNGLLVKGVNIHLTINLSFQQKLEDILDESKKKYDADEVIVAVMESSTAKVLAMASSNRYNITQFRKKDILSVIPKFTAYPYEPGAVMQPIGLAIALDKGLLDPETVFNTYDGKIELEKDIFIRDYQKFNTLSATDIIVHSSNVGMSQIAWLLSGRELYEGLEKFEFLEPSGVLIVRDKKGTFRLSDDLENKLYRAGASYGYGMLATFTQLLKAYNVFNNYGILTVPQLIDFVEDKATRIENPFVKNNTVEVVSAKTVKQVKSILIENVQRGTATKAQHKGLEIGGKTGTAFIARNGKYMMEYHSSFYGFVNDKEGNKYTIGVLIIRPKGEETYLAAHSAVPLFGEVVDLLVANHYLAY